MLKQRVITAVAMAALFLAAIFWLPLSALALVFAVVVALGGWEWAHLSGWEKPALRAIYPVLLLAIMAGLYYYCAPAEGPSRERVQPLLGMTCLWWSFALLWVKSYPSSAILWRSVAVRSLMGVLILAFAWLAAVFLLSHPRGGVLMVIMVLLVVAADVGAYFTGKSLGRHHMAPAVSPAKTWEGFWGGVASVVLVASIIWSLLPARYDHLSYIAILAIAVTTALASVVGDLTVSMVKRESGLKDSGSMLPGHGGLLDRLDSLCGAAPVFALGLLLAGY
jgi:phosphatidate cytidylyltransferase